MGLHAVSVPSPNTKNGFPRLTRSTCPDSDFKNAVGPHGSSAHTGFDQQVLERQLGKLKRENRLLNADCRQ